jgi:diphosphomevalonate decarboxylase
LPTYEGDTWLQYRHLWGIVNNTTLSNAQKLYYLIALLKDEAKDLRSNLQITNENFLVAWQLVTQRYNNKQLIAIMHAKHLCQMPKVKKGDALLLRQLINHVSRHMNALQALFLNVPVQDLMLYHLMLATLDNDTHQQWELNTASRTDLPTTAELITFLESRCRAFELLQNTQSLKVVTTNPRVVTPARSKVSKPSYCNVATPTVYFV